MYKIEELRIIINEQLLDYYKNRKPIGLYEPIDYVLSEGGKRIRPVLCLMACNMFNENIQDAIKPAIGLETFHNFTLLHDDIMDKANVRRGKTTVHKKWNENTAILSGDAMMIEAYEQFLSLPPTILAQVLPIFNRTALEVCEGQQYDVDFEEILEISENEYLKMIRLKTAVLLAASLQIGAIIGKASTEDAQKMYNFGIAIGMAFQLQDDYLDTFGDEKTFGKKIGGDIIENKKTLLLITALKQKKEKILPLLSETNITKKIQEITKIYKESNIDTVIINKMDDYYQEAVQILETLSIEEERKIPLLSFLSQLKIRVH